MPTCTAQLNAQEHKPFDRTVQLVGAFSKVHRSLVIGLIDKRNILECILLASSIVHVISHAALSY